MNARALIAEMVVALVLVSVGAAGSAAFLARIDVPPPLGTVGWGCAAAVVELGDVEPDLMEAPPDVEEAWRIVIAARPTWPVVVTDCEVWGMSKEEIRVVAPSW